MRTEDIVVIEQRTCRAWTSGAAGSSHKHGSDWQSALRTQSLPIVSAAMKKSIQLYQEIFSLSKLHLEFEGVPAFPVNNHFLYMYGLDVSLRKLVPIVLSNQKCSGNAGHGLELCFDTVQWRHLPIYINWRSVIS